MYLKVPLRIIGISFTLHIYNTGNITQAASTTVVLSYGGDFSGSWQIGANATLNLTSGTYPTPPRDNDWEE
jgi:hypothetical protein